MNLLARLSKEYIDYETKIETKDGSGFFVIVNPFWHENIRISLDDESIFFFSFHHAHCDCDVDYLVEYINNFLHGKWVSIEFFQEATDLFGGARDLDDIDISSGDSLLRSFTGDNDSLYDHLYKQIKGLNCRCSIRGWDNANNKDIDFVL